MTNPFEDDEGGVQVNTNTNTNSNTNIEEGPTSTSSSIEGDNKDDHHHSSEEEQEEQDLDALLDDMDFDKDFSIRSSDESEDAAVAVLLADKDEDDTSPKEKEEASIQFWKERFQREEVYSKRYHPSKEEQQELQELATFLGLSSSASGFLTGFLRASSAVLTGDSGNRVEQLLQPEEGHPHSILLKRGPVLWNKQECELILLTHGFILATTTSAQNQKAKSMFVQQSAYETCQLWDQVQHATNIPETNCSLGVVCKGGSGDESSSLWEFQVDSVDSHTAWLQAMETVLVQHALHHSSKDSSKTSQLGWQYQLMHRPGYTGVVTGNVDLIGTNSGDNFNSLDTYQQMAPLHYALQQEECSIPVIEALLVEGADPNFPDADKRTAMYYAERNKVCKQVVDLLMHHGGKASELARVEERGELFGNAADAHAKSEQRRATEKATKDLKVAESAAKAESAKGAMGDAMNALHIRGQKINELGEKTQELEENAKTYGSLASQLKDKVKAKKWYQL